ncbi:MAG: hypothetical protein AAB786_01305 [Patescibacteria group bacterium]
MKKEVKSKMNIDKLAIMVAKGFENTTYEIKSVNEKLDRHDKVFHLIMKELKAMNDDRKYFKENISSLNSDGLSYNRKIENLTMRVEKLESNTK